MFGLLVSDKMNPFILNISSFPTVIFTVLLGVCIVFWACAVLGVINIDAFDFDMDFEIADFSGLDIDLEINVDGLELEGNSGDATSNVLAGLLLRYGLVGVPVTVSLSILILFGWMICYYMVHFLFPFIPNGIIEIVSGLPIFLTALYLSAKITSYVIRPLKPLFIKATQQTDKKVLGQVAVVRTSRVDNDFGEALLNDGGAGLIMKVRTKGDDRFVKGDKVIIFEKLNSNNIYRVISEKEFIKPN